MIPATFHRVWLKTGPDDVIPDRFEGFWERFQELHPGADFRTWDSIDELDWIENREAFDAATTHAGRSDIARYEILARYGGIYVDTDVEPLRPFTSLLIDDRPFAAWENHRLLCPTVIGAPMRHPAMLDLVAALPTWVRTHPGAPPNQQTGPHFFTARWRHRRDVRKLASATFYPVGWWERAKLGGPYPEQTYAVHHWNQGWDTEAKAAIDARQRV